MRRSKSNAIAHKKPTTQTPPKAPSSALVSNCSPSSAFLKECSKALRYPDYVPKSGVTLAKISTAALAASPADAPRLLGLKPQYVFKAWRKVSHMAKSGPRHANLSANLRGFPARKRTEQLRCYSPSIAKTAPTSGNSPPDQSTATGLATPDQAVDFSSEHCSEQLHNHVD